LTPCLGGMGCYPNSSSSSGKPRTCTRVRLQQRLYSPDYGQGFGFPHLR